jgi:hypothetical protein
MHTRFRQRNRRKGQIAIRQKSRKEKTRFCVEAKFLLLGKGVALQKRKTADYR